MWIQFAVTKTATGAMKIGQAPTHTAMPRVTITSPRYIGLRVKRYGPLVMSLRLVGEGQKRRFADVRVTSASPPKADIHHEALHVRKVPRSDNCAPA